MQLHAYFIAVLSFPAFIPLFTAGSTRMWPFGFWKLPKTNLISYWLESPAVVWVCRVWPENRLQVEKERCKDSITEVQMYRRRSWRVEVIHHCHFGINTSGAGQKTSSESAAAGADAPREGKGVKLLWPCRDTSMSARHSGACGEGSCRVQSSLSLAKAQRISGLCVKNVFLCL